MHPSPAAGWRWRQGDAHGLASLCGSQVGIWWWKKKKIIVHSKSHAFWAASMCIWDKQLLKRETRGHSIENHNKHREAFVETSFIISTSTHRLVYLRTHPHSFPNGVISEISTLKTTICHTKSSNDTTQKCHSFFSFFFVLKLLFVPTLVLHNNNLA